MIYVLCPVADLPVVTSAVADIECGVITPDSPLPTLKSEDELLHFRPHALKETHNKFLFESQTQGSYVCPLVSYLENLGNKTNLELLTNAYFYENRFSGIKSRRRVARIKRLIDITCSLFLLLISLPILAVLAIAIKATSKGTVVYKQARVGLYGKEFIIYKLRTMCVNAEEKGAVWAKKNDSRVTRVGAFLRKTRLDELPQAYNVLKGDMSFVGPRPERRYFTEKLKCVIPYYDYRMLVKPGITGLSQVEYKYGETVDDAKEKHSYDLFYIKNYSLKLDFIILLKTIKVVLTGSGQ